METLLLALPYLHAELMPDSARCRTLWPGLPRRPENAWEPALPFSGSMAAACLADYERACRDGASGSPVLTLGAEGAPADLSPAERRALREMAGLPAEEPEPSLRLTAQQMLLLIWLQERQALEMAALEQKISDSRRALSGLISGITRTASSPCLPGEKDLPDWRKALFAALAFVQDMPESTAFTVASAAMAAALADTEAPRENTPSGGKALSFRVSELAALCGRNECARLKRELDPGQWNRTLTFFLPEDTVR